MTRGDLLLGAVMLICVMVVVASMASAVWFAPDPHIAACAPWSYEIPQPGEPT